MELVRDKDFILFDLDDTLTESKTIIETEMADLLSRLLVRKKTGIISGSSFSQFKKQLLVRLPDNAEILSALYLLPTCGAALYVYKNGAWGSVYAELLTKEEVKKIMSAFKDVLLREELSIDKTYGNQFENRGTQIAFSALGQNAPLHKKRLWDPAHRKRIRLKKALDLLLPEFEVRIGGTTTIDVTRKGIDKAYGILQIEKHLRIKRDQILFIGDSLFEGGNDYPVKAAGVECIASSGVRETKQIIMSLL